MTSSEHEMTIDENGGRDERAPAPRMAGLRGARAADVDPARLRAIVVAICAVALAVTAVALFIAGARRNAQVAALHDNGTRVAVTVTDCRGQLGGGGFSFVGYACRGTYALHDHQYDVAIPGSALRPTGSKVTLVTNLADPRLVTTVRSAATSQPSARVYVLPGALVALLVGLGVAEVLRRRSSHRPRGVVLTIS